MLTWKKAAGDMRYFISRNLSSTWACTSISISISVSVGVGVILVLVLVLVLVLGLGLAHSVVYNTPKNGHCVVQTLVPKWGDCSRKFTT